ncbi:MAG: hypothetical protein KAJ19_29060 [Gammaproteobacteria bacterium]|nr:hypothetical protein [Gammaproteobacteria bacterium]
MKRLSVLLIISFLTQIYGNAAFAEGKKRIPYRNPAATNISVSGNPGTLNISFAIAGFEPFSETDATTTYDISNDGSTVKITGSLNSAVPANTQLLLSLAAPTGATSTGWQYLTTSPSNLVTSIGTLDESGLTITYRFFAPTSAGIIASSQRTVTLTVADQ